MVKQFFILIGVLFSIHLKAQTGIGTTTPHSSAKLDVTSTNKGFLPPRVALTGVYDVSTIPSPATGLLVYCTGTNGLASGYYFFNGTAWATIATEGGSGSVAAEFGAQFLSSNVSITSGTPVDVLSFTLPSAGTWEVITFLRAQGAAGYASEFAIYDASNNLVPNSEILPAYGEIASTGTGVVRITTNGSAVYKVRAWASSGAFNVTSDFNGRTGVTWKKISGNAPVTGQSVDYVSVSTIYQTAIGDNRDLIFTTNNGGNIPYNTSTGVFTLSANKTYLFQAQVRANTPSVNSSYIEYGFVDATTNSLLINGTETITSSTTATAGYGSNPVINFIFTPSTNQIVKLRTTVNSNGTQTIVSGTANITQIGSSAIINPWTLSGSNTYNTTGNVGIGTSTPNTSAILDISSSSKGVLPPKVLLTGRNGTSSPIVSPTTGLFVYNMAEAGTASNAVSPGFYFYNGTNWTRMDPEDWSIPVSITIGAVTTAPTKGTIVYDKVSYRRTSTTSFEVTYNYSQSTAGTAGSGNYLFRLPGNLTFGSSVLKTTSSSYEDMVNRVIIGNGYYGDASGRFRPIGIIPYDNNRFRIMIMDNTSQGLIVGASDVGLNTDGASYKFSFILETN